MLSCFCTIAAEAYSDPEKELKNAVYLQENGRWSEALPLFKSLLKNDSGSVELLWRTSYLYSQLGSKQPSEKVKQQWYLTSSQLAKKAISVSPKNANAHYAYALALGRMNENASSRTKIDYARLIKSEAETALKYDPKLAGPYHILGRWHRIVAGFNMIERTMINAVFGGMPAGTYEDAIHNFEKAISLEPKVGIHYYELALTLNERDNKGDTEKAKQWLKKAMNIPAISPIDKEHRALCEGLLKELD